MATNNCHLGQHAGAQSINAAGAIYEYDGH